MFSFLQKNLVTISKSDFKQKIINNKNIYIYCQKSVYHYFEDYIKTINKKLNATIIYDFSENITLNENNIIICMQQIPPLKNIIKKNIYLLNTEQLTRTICLNYIKSISNNFTIIDYSKENIYIMKNNGITNTLYFPYIYNPDENYNYKKIYNICGISMYNASRRKNFMNYMKFKNIDIKNIIGWNEKRDNELFRYKIILNISASKHYNIFETIRCYRCLFNKMIVISEEKYKQDLIDYSEHILFAKITDIPELIKKVLSNYEYYYNLLKLDNVNYNLNDHLIKPSLLRTVKMEQNSIKRGPKLGLFFI